MPHAPASVAIGTLLTLLTAQAMALGVGRFDNHGALGSPLHMVVDLRLDDGEYHRSNISYGKSVWKHFPNTLLNVGARIDSVRRPSGRSPSTFVCHHSSRCSRPCTK